MPRPRRVPDWLALAPGEQLLELAGANRTVGPIAAGGRLALTTQRLVHHTHGMERGLTGTGDWAVPHGAIAAVDLAPRSGNPFDGGLRKRLRVRGHEGGEALFVVNGAARWVAAIEAARSGAASALLDPR